MSRNIRSGLIQCSSTHSGDAPLAEIKEAMIAKHMGLIEEAGKQGVQALCLQEIFSSATVAGLSEYLWKLEQPAHAVANGYFIGAINRVGREQPWDMGEFYGQSYFCDPRGQIIAEASRSCGGSISPISTPPGSWRMCGFFCGTVDAGCLLSHPNRLPVLRRKGAFAREVVFVFKQATIDRVGDHD